MQSSIFELSAIHRKNCLCARWVWPRGEKNMEAINRPARVTFTGKNVLLSFVLFFSFTFVASNLLSRNCSVEPCTTPSYLLNSQPTGVPLAAKNASSYTTVKPEHHEKSSNGIDVAKWDFTRVQTPFVVCIWILLASVAKIGIKLLINLCVFIIWENLV